MTESLAVVGLVVPGAVLMVAAGALIGVGAVEFWPLLIAAIVGAVAGDGVSFWLGRHYQDRLRRMWPFSRYPHWLAHGERYFHRHGGKSIVLGRFVGPVRPFVPVVAGMLGMRPRYFYGVNLLSAILWAPCYLLPGMAFGASLALAGEVAARLVVVMLLLGALILFVLWFMRWLYRYMSPRAGRLAEGMLDWGGRHPRLNQFIRGLLDPSQPEAKTLLILALLLIGASWVFLDLLEDVVTADPLLRADQGFYQLMLNLRTPWSDRAMVLITELGDGIVIGLLAAVVLAWLLWSRCWRAAAYWGAAIVFGQLIATLIKLGLQRPRPLENIYDGLSTYAFPSGHATMSMVAYGFLAVMISRYLPATRRWLVYALAALLILFIALSRLYLGAHWLSDILGGLSLGLAWVCLLGIAYYRHQPLPDLPRGLLRLSLVTLVLVGGWHLSGQYSIDLQRYAPRPLQQQQQQAHWWQDGWRELPVFRVDLVGRYQQPFNVQWSGSLDELRQRLLAAGWLQPMRLDAGSALRWLSPDLPLQQLPTLPQVHDGRHETLLMIAPAPEPEQLLALRLWQSGFELNPGANSLWVGNVSLLQQQRFPFLRLPLTLPQYDLPLRLLRQSLPDIEQRQVTRAAQYTRRFEHWDGSVCLLRLR